MRNAREKRGGSESRQRKRPVETLDDTSKASHTRVFSSLRSVTKFIRAILVFQKAGTSNGAVILGSQEAQKSKRPTNLKRRMGEALALYEAGEYLQGAAEFEQLHVVAKRELGDSHPTTLTVRDNIALGLEVFGYPEQAQSIYEEVLLSRNASDDPDTADTMHGLARTNQRCGDPENAYDFYTAVLKRRTSVLGWETTETVRIAKDLIEMLIENQIHIPEALQLCNEFLQRLPEHSDAIVTFTALQDKIDGMLHERSVFQKALELAKLKQRDGTRNSDGGCGSGSDSEQINASEMAKALAYGEREVGMDDPDVISIVELLAESLQDAADSCRREDLYVRAWISRTVEEGPTHPLTMRALHRFRSYLVTLGRFREAERISDAAVQGQEAWPEHPNPQHGAIEVNVQYFQQLFTLHFRSEEDWPTPEPQLHRRIDDSSQHEHENERNINDSIKWITNTRAVAQLEQILHRTVEKREQLLGPDNPTTLEARRAVAMLQLTQKRDRQAELAMQAILKRCKHILGKSHPQTLSSMCHLAIVLSGAATKELKAEAQSLSQAALFGHEDQFGLHHCKTVSCYNLLLNHGLTHWNFTKECRPPFIHVENVASGGSSTVNSVQRWVNTGMANTGRASTKTYAQKIFRIPGGRRDEYLKMIQNEIDVIQQLKHSHIVHIVCTYQEPKNFAIILSPLADEDLESFLYRQNTDGSETLDRCMVTGWFYCLARTLTFIHSHGVRHKDIKPRNILVKAGKLYFADFGSSRICHSELTSSTDGYFVGGNTKMYSAPEVMNNARRSRSADIFSLGCVFTEMATILDGRSLTDYNNFRVSDEPDGNRVETHVYWKNLDKVDKWFETAPQPSSCYTDLIKPMLSVDRDARPWANDIAETVLRLYGGEINCTDCSLHRISESDHSSSSQLSSQPSTKNCRSQVRRSGNGSLQAKTSHRQEPHPSLQQPPTLPAGQATERPTAGEAGLRLPKGAAAICIETASRGVRSRTNHNRESLENPV